MKRFLKILVTILLTVPLILTAEMPSDRELRENPNLDENKEAADFASMVVAKPYTQSTSVNRDGEKKILVSVIVANNLCFVTVDESKKSVQSRKNQLQAKRLVKGKSECRKVEE